MMAAKFGKVVEAKLLLEAGANPNAVDKNGWGVLMWAQESPETLGAIMELLQNHYQG